MNANRTLITSSDAPEAAQSGTEPQPLTPPVQPITINLAAPAIAKTHRVRHLLVPAGAGRHDHRQRCGRGSIDCHHPGDGLLRQGRRRVGPGARMNRYVVRYQTWKAAGAETPGAAVDLTGESVAGQWPDGGYIVGNGRGILVAGMHRGAE